MSDYVQHNNFKTIS